MTSRGQCPRGGACECPRVGAFFKLMTSRGQCPRGGGVRLVFHPSKFRPPPPTHTHTPGWLATGLYVFATREESEVTLLKICPFLYNSLVRYHPIIFRRSPDENYGPKQ